LNSVAVPQQEQQDE